MRKRLLLLVLMATLMMLVIGCTQELEESTQRLVESTQELLEISEDLVESSEKFVESSEGLVESTQELEQSAQGLEESQQSVQENLQSVDESQERVRKSIGTILIQYVEENIAHLAVKIGNVYEEILEAEDLRPELKRQKLAGGIDETTLEKANKLIRELHQIRSDLEDEFILEINTLKQEVEKRTSQETKERLLSWLEELEGDIEYLKRAVYKAIIALHSA